VFGGQPNQRPKAARRCPEFGKARVGLAALAFLSLSACDSRPDQWDAFVYTGDDLLTNETIRGFTTFELCQQAAIDRLRSERPDGGGDYECGYKCEPRVTAATSAKRRANRRVAALTPSSPKSGPAANDPLRTFEVPGKLTDDAGSGGWMIEVLYVLAGATVAILLDWAIYTHLSAFIRVGFPTTPHARYRDLALGSAMASVRTFSVGAVGVSAGVAFALKDANLWLVAAGLFVLGHSMLYGLLYKRGEG
jgi:hypothetical protein